MLHVIRSPLPGFRSVTAELPARLAQLLAQLHEHPERCHWVVPTGRLRRSLLREWLSTEVRSAAILPGMHTLESFVSWALEYSLCQRPQIDEVERVFRVAHAWQSATSSPAGPGLLGQLDRYIRDWQACGLTPLKGARDPFDLTVWHYTQGLEKDRLFDRMLCVTALEEELRNEESCLRRMLLAKTALVLFDGFHRLEPIELRLIATLAEHCDVVLWLVSTPGQTSARTVDAELQNLKQLSPNLTPWVVDPSPSSAGFAVLGRQLFPQEHGPVQAQSPPPGLWRLQPSSQMAELESVARYIKADYLAANSAVQERDGRTDGGPLRLSDVAVVVPDATYDALVREVFPRHGLEFNLAGRALLLSASRPARLIHAALALMRGQWRQDLLRDFLRHPFILRQLDCGHLLEKLFEARPRARKPLDFVQWMEAWQHLVDGRAGQISRWESDEPLPSYVTSSREEYVADEQEKLASLRALIASLANALQPVARMEQVLAQGDEQDAMRQLLDCCCELLRFVGIADRLSASEAAIDCGRHGLPWVEYEKDQQAYAKLLALLQKLALMPTERLPTDRQGHRDPLGALLLALENESYQIKTEDDAGVQVFELREIRGLRFRHVYVLGLIDGQLPTLPEEGLLVSRRRQIEPLRVQLEQKEAETQYLFTQVFEAATEKLVLSQPQGEVGERQLPSPFLMAVRERTDVPELERPALVASLASAGRMIGTRLRIGQSTEASTSTEVLRANPALEKLQRAVDPWRARAHWPHLIKVDLPALMRALFPDTRPFSATALESYAACPFRYFGKQVLRLHEQEQDDAKLSYGSLVHRVFERLYAELRQKLQLTIGKPLPPLTATDRDLLRDLFTDEWTKHPEGLLSPELVGLFTHPHGVSELFFQTIAQLETDYGNLCHEQALGDSQGHGVVIGRDRAGRQVAVTGKIDRVDARRDDPRKLALADYKTGTPKDRGHVEERLADGRMLQLPLYAVTLQETDKSVEVIAGYYVHVSEKPLSEGKADKPMLVSAATGSRDDTPPRFDPETARRLALEFVGRIRDGDFSLTGHATGNNGECNQYCTLRHACRQPAGYK
jgi:hypothetical protein